MKIVCSQSDLKNNLALVSRVVPSRPEPAVLGNVAIDADETTQKVSLVGFDGSLGIETSFHAEVVEAGSITLPAKLLNDIVTRLPEMEITLEVPNDEASFVATIGSTSGQFQLTGIEATEFPELPTVEEIALPEEASGTRDSEVYPFRDDRAAQTLELPISILNRGLGGCLFAASAELSKQVLTGVHLKTSGVGSNKAGDILEFAATDSHRLAVVATNLNEADSDATIELPKLAVTIPAKALRELERIVSDGEATDKVKISFDDRVIIFRLGDRLLTSTMIAGDYPAYEQLIPQRFAREIVLNRKRLLSCLELVAVLAQKNNIVKFSANNDKSELILSANAQDVGNAQQSLPAQIIGEDIEIAFNIKYLMDGLKALSAAEIKMQLNEWNQPVVFSPLDGLQMTYLVMPVQIRN